MGRNSVGLPPPSGATTRLVQLNWSLLLGGLIVGLIVVIAIAGPRLAPRDPLEENAIINVDGEWKIPPFPALSEGFPLGSDEFGRDLMSRLLWAVRPTMVVVSVVAIVRLLLGMGIGMSAGWFTGWTGRAADALIGAALSVPVLMVALGAIAAVGIEAGIWAFIIGLSINGWVETARLVREQTRLVKGQLYIEAARALGASDAQVVLRHVLRQIMPMIWMLFAFEVGGTLMVTAALGFLGYYIGGDVWVLVDDAAARRISGAPELGQMLASNWTLGDVPWAMIAVGSVVVITVLGFNLLGRGLRGRLSLRKISRDSFSSRVQEAVFVRVTEPTGRWLERHLWTPLERQKKRQGFYPLIAGVILVAAAGFILWRLQVSHAVEFAAPKQIDQPEQLWASERRDPQGTRWSRSAQPVLPEIQWVFEDPAGFSGGPAISRGGIVYIASRDGMLYALNSDGGERWHRALPADAIGTPAVGRDGSVFVADERGNLSAVEANGEIRWVYRADEDDFATSGPIVGPEGKIYYMVRGGIVQTVSDDGQGLWRTRALSEPVYTPPRLSADGRWVFVKNVALDANSGAVQNWSAPVEVDRFIPGADASNYLQSGNEIYRWNPESSRIETTQWTTWDHRQFAVRAEGGPTDAGVTPQENVWLLYASNREDTRIVWVSMSGRMIGNFHYGQRNTEVIAVDQDEVTYACGAGRSGNVECFALELGQDDPSWELVLDSGHTLQGGALVSGRLYVSTREGQLYAIGEGEALPLAEQASPLGPPQREESGWGPEAEQILWVFEDPSGFMTKPTVSVQGNVYITASGGTLYALGPQGDVLWDVPLPAAPVGAPALGRAGEVFQADREGNLSAFGADGTPLWRYRPSESKPSTVGPVVGPDGSLYYTVGSSVHAVSAQGEALWQTRAETFRSYTPLQLSADGSLLFYAEDIFSTKEGALLDLESTVQVDRFIQGDDDQGYLRTGNTIIKWRLQGSSIEILSTAQWNYEGIVSSQATPEDVGVTKDGTIWLLYTTPWGSSTIVAWIDIEGQVLGTARPDARVSAAQVVGVRPEDATTFLCGFKNRAQGYSPATIQCYALSIGSEQPSWQIEIGETTQIGGGALAPGRLYLTTAEGQLYAVGEDQPTTQSHSEAASTQDKGIVESAPSLPLAEVAWHFRDSSGFSSGPAVASDGTVYIASKDAKLYALDPIGNPSWQADLPDQPVGPPRVAPGGVIYQADRSGNLSAFDPDGILRWRFEPPENTPSTVGPVVGPNGTIYYTIGTSVQAVTPDGNGLWRTRARTFRTLTPLQLDPERGLLFFADDAFRIEDGALLDIEGPVDPDQLIAGKDGNLYLRDGHTVMQWQLNGSRMEIIQSAQWDYSSFAGSQSPPQNAGVTREGVIWMAYTRWSGAMAWVDITGQVLGTSHSGLDSGHVLAVQDDDAQAYLCGTEHSNTAQANAQCVVLAPGSREAIWRVHLTVDGEQENVGEVTGGVLVPGRLYAATADGYLFAVGEGSP